MAARTTILFRTPKRIGSPTRYKGSYIHICKHVPMEREIRLILVPFVDDETLEKRKQSENHQKLFGPRALLLTSLESRLLIKKGIGQKEVALASPDTPSKLMYMRSHCAGAIWLSYFDPDTISEEQLLDHLFHCFLFLPVGWHTRQ